MRGLRWPRRPRPATEDAAWDAFFEEDEDLVRIKEVFADKDEKGQTGPKPDETL